MSLSTFVLGLNLWGRPFALIVLAMFLRGVGARFQGTVLAGLTELVTMASNAMLLIALALVGWGCWKLWCAATGRGELCHGCGGPTRLIDPGRYSPHYRCLACGLNRRADR